MLNTSDTQYVINSTKKAYYMWLASPSANGAYDVVYVDYYGNVYSSRYDNSLVGFRPLVCLNSNVTLKSVEGGFEIE